MKAVEVDDELIDSIDSVLDLFGKATKYLIYSNWLSVDAPQHGVLSDPERFSQSLRELFGIGGASVEILFVREIRKHFIELGMILPPTENFASLVKQIRAIGKSEESV